MSHRFMYSNLIGESTAIGALTAAAGFVGGAVPRVANGPGSMIFSGSYTGDDPEIYTAEIDLEGDVGTATFKWRKSTSTAGAWEASGLATALTDTALEAGVNVRFLNGSSSPAFEMGDRWQATATRFRSPKRVIDLDPATKWRGGAPASDPEYLTFDLATAQAPDAVVVHGHNISSGATVKIQGGPVPLDHAIDIATTSGHVSVPDAASNQNIFAGGGEIRLAAYVRNLTIGSGIGDLITKSHPAGSVATSWGLQLTSVVGGSADVIFVRYFDTPVTAVWTSASKVPLNTRLDIKLNYDDSSAANVPTLTVNDVVITMNVTIAATGSAVPDAGIGNNVTIGRNTTTLASSPDGIIDQVELEKGGAIKAIYKFTEGAGTTAADTSGNGNTGTFGGSATWANDVFAPVDETLTWQADTMFRYLTTSPRSYRYWRLLITGDSANADGRLDMAEVFLGAYFEPAYNYEFGNVLGEQSFEETRETESKAEKTVLLNRGRTAALPYRHVTEIEKNLFLTMFRAVKDTAAERNKPLFVHLDVDDGESLIFAAIGGPFSPNEEGPDDFSFELELRERLA